MQSVLQESTSIPQLGKGPERGRLQELDALRGLAALTVVFHHFESLLRPSHESAGMIRDACLKLLHGDGFHAFVQAAGATRVFDLTPAYFAVAGHEPVVLFFVLSGFVLALPFYRGRAPSYTAFLTKRIFRIYVPYLVAIFFAILLNATISRGGIPGFNEWFNQTWRLPVTGGAIASHVLFLGKYDAYQFNTAIWSLVHEMRISLAFPAILFIASLRLPFAAGVYGTLSVAGTFLNHRFEEADAGYFASLHYAALFGIGALIAKNRAEICRVYAMSSNLARAAFVFAGLSLYLYGRFLSIPRYAISGDLAIGFGAGILVVLALASMRAQSLLAPSWCGFLGRVSYSLYLMHGTVLFALVYLLYPWAPWPVIGVLYVILALVCAQIGYRFVEAPAIEAGKALASRLGRGQRQ